VKEKNTRKPIDAAIALAMALHDARENTGIDTSEPLVLESPFADVSQFDRSKEQKIKREQHLPPELRDFTTDKEKAETWDRWEKEQKINA
jgi:hypothetical protein